MVMSAAERKRREEEEDAELYFSNLTRGEFYRLPERARDEARQRYTRVGATHVGYWKDCDLAKCRRAKRCIGFLSDAQYKASRLRAYPPCIREKEARRAKVYQALGELIRTPDDLPYYDGPMPPAQAEEED